MNLYAIPPLISAFLGYTLGTFVYFKNRKSKINICFLYQCFSISTWYLGFGLSLISEYNWWFFIKLGLTGVIFAPILYIHFIIYYFQTKKFSVYLKLYYSFAFLSLISLYTNKFFFSNEIYVYPWGNYPKAGFFESANCLVTLITIFILYSYLFKKYLGFKKMMVEKTIKAADYDRFRYIFIAYLIFAFAAVDYLPKHGINIYPCGFVPFNIFTLIISYAIVKHQLLDINIFIRRGLIYSILVTLITVIYFLLVFLTENIFRGVLGYKSVPITLLMVTFFILFFQPLKNKIQSFVDKYFFKGTQEMLARENERLMEEIRRTDRLKAIATLAAGMAHEIKNPLTSIKTFTEYIDEKYPDKDYREKFKRIVGNEVDKINKIVGQLLDFAKPKPLSIQRVDINGLLDDTLSLLSNDLIKKRIDIIRRYAVKASINADANRLKQAFLNLLLNAEEAMENGGKLVITTNKTNNNQLEITIEDTGKGIPKKDISSIFDPFYSTKESGTGLGLSIVYGIIKEHNGSISCESELGKGTKFLIMLPY